MACKIKVKLILELRAAQMSQCEISRTRKMSQHSVGDVYRIADKLGVNLKLLWNEYKYSCFQTHSLSLGYTKFCEGYSDHIVKNSLTSHLLHKTGIVCEVDWSGSTMSLDD